MSNETKTMTCDIEAGPFSKVTDGKQILYRLGLPEDFSIPENQVKLLAIIYWQQGIIDDLEKRVEYLEVKK